MDKETKTMQGIAVSPGIAVGEAYLLSREIEAIPRFYIPQDRIDEETMSFENAIALSIEQLKHIKDKFSEKIGKKQAFIFEAKIMMLQDEMLTEKIKKKIKKKQINAEWALKETISELIEIFSGFDDEYLKERKTDIGNLGKRILINLTGKTPINISSLKEGTIIFAHDLAPSDTAQMHKDNILGFATDIGGKTSHTAIMARSLEIPAVVGLEDITQRIQTGDEAILDGNSGKVIVNPDKDTVEQYREKQQTFSFILKDLEKLKDLPAITLDGHQMAITANIELADEIKSVLQHGADGIGLYRTEFLYLNRKTLPSEEEQFNNYKILAQAIHPLPAAIRTMDLGGDKFISHVDLADDMNPAMGLRAIRFCLDQPEIFKTQLKAILRASLFGNLKILYPMISGIKELRKANSILEECKKELSKKGIPFNENIPVGIMIEVPTAAMIADLLAKEVEFFSIGTNDLIQYSLAIDRVNEKVAYLYEPFHPAILRTIHNIVTVAHENNIPVSLCGEMGGDAIYTVMLTGLQLDELSMNPVSMLNIKRIIRNLRLDEAKKAVKEAMTLKTADEIEDYLRSISTDELQ